MTAQPEALDLADWLDDLFDSDGEPKRAAAELRRLHAENEELRKAVSMFVKYDNSAGHPGEDDYSLMFMYKEAIEAARAAMKEAGK